MTERVRDYLLFRSLILEEPFYKNDSILFGLLQRSETLEDQNH